APAEEASAASNQPRYNYALTLSKACHAGADFLDDPDALVTEHEARLDGKAAMLKMQVEAAYSRSRDAYDCGRGRLEFCVLDLLDAYIVRPVKNPAFHNPKPRPAHRAGHEIPLRGDGYIVRILFAAAAKCMIMALGPEVFHDSERQEDPCPN